MIVARLRHGFERGLSLTTATEPANLQLTKTAGA
jgi:hypothetical protein